MSAQVIRVKTGQSVPMALEAMNSHVLVPRDGREQIAKLVNMCI